MRYVLTVKRFFDKSVKYSSVEAKINPQTSAFQYLNTGLGISYQSFFSFPSYFIPLGYSSCGTDGRCSHAKIAKLQNF